MTNIDKKRLEMELLRVTAAKYDLEIRVEEMSTQILELKQHIQVQINKELELQLKIKG
jgi:hypothetical protein